MVENNKLLEIKAKLKTEEPLKKHCTFFIGGNAKYFAEPTQFGELIDIINWAKESNMPYRVIGNASNILFKDQGYNGVIISTKKITGSCQIEETKLMVSAGEQLYKVVTTCANLGLSGMEFAVGIPGTIGGAIIMNAGAFGGAIADVVESVTYFDGNQIKTLYKDAIKFGERESLFLYNKDAIVMYATLCLKKDDSKQILLKMNENVNKRKLTQPYGRSAGCIFKRCESGEPAGKLIDECGLKGKSVGGAEISNVHANFILNTNNATSQDVERLIDLARSEVKAKYNKELKLEIEII